MFDLKSEVTSKTKEQFLSERLADKWCPQSYGLKNVFKSVGCKGTFTCRRCWEEATKNVKFE